MIWILEDIKVEKRLFEKTLFPLPCLEWGLCRHWSNVLYIFVSSGWDEAICTTRCVVAVISCNITAAQSCMCEWMGAYPDAGILTYSHVDCLAMLAVVLNGWNQPKCFQSMIDWWLAINNLTIDYRLVMWYAKQAFIDQYGEFLWPLDWRQQISQVLLPFQAFLIIIFGFSLFSPVPPPKASIVPSVSVGLAWAAWTFLSGTKSWNLIMSGNEYVSGDDDDGVIVIWSW